MLKQIPSFVKDLDINLSQKQLRKTFAQKAFSGGKDTKEEQKQFGANLDIDESFSVLKLFADKTVIERVQHLYGPDELKLNGSSHFVLKPQGVSSLSAGANEERMMSGEVKTLAADALFKFIQEQAKDI